MIELKNYEERLKKIFNKQAYDGEEILDLIEKGYTAPESIVKNAILFVGINPSLGRGKEPIRGFYKDPLREEDNSIPYFDKMKEVGKKLHEYDSTRKLAFASFDLLYFQETHQRSVDSLLRVEKKNGKGGLDFIWEQLELSQKILEEAQPQILVVSNTKARQFLGRDMKQNKKGERDMKQNKKEEWDNEWLGYTFEPEVDKEFGTHKITGNNLFKTRLVGTPVFFTSMLSGQRALDNGSYERLVWHIDFVLKKLSNG